MNKTNLNKSGYKETKIGLIPEDWRVEKLGDKMNCFSGGTPSRSNMSYYNGSIPWIKSGELNKKFIYYTEEFIDENAIRDSATRYIEPDTLLYALYGATAGIPAFSKIKATINQAILAIVTTEDLDSIYLYFWLFHNKKDLLNVYTQGAQPNLSAQIVKDYTIPLPPLPEQKKIADILSTWDRAIEKTEKLIDVKTKLKKGLMQQLLTGQKRFKVFIKSDRVILTRYGNIPAEWSYIHIKEIAKEVSVKNKNGKNLTVLSCTKYDGLIDSLKYFKRQVFSDDTSTYKIVKHGQFAYATNHIEEGSIGYQNVCDEALISPMYTVFETNDKVNDEYLYKLLKTELYRHIFEVNTSASVDRRGSLRWDEFSLIKIPLPALDEQQRIASVLSTIDKEISTLNKKLKALKQQKKGLMQKLLTGEVRVKV